MIGKHRMAAQQRHLGHVAANTIHLAHRARLHWDRMTRFFRLGMARQAFCIVKGDILIDRLVRVVTRHATDALVIADEASAIGQPVWLEAHVRWPMPMVSHRRLPGAMALPAEVFGVLGTHALEGCRPSGEVVAQSVGQVLLRAFMAALAPHPGANLIERQSFPRGRVGRVAVEALHQFPH